MLLVFSSNLGPLIRPVIQTVNPKPLSMLILWSKAFHAPIRNPTPTEPKLIAEQAPRKAQ